MRKLGWRHADVILVSGDAYVDSPYSGVAVIGQVLAKAGYRVAILSQPDMSDPDGPFVISGSFRTWTGVIPVSFKMYIQADGTGRIIFYSNDGGQVTFTGDIVSPNNASTIYPLP